MYMSIKLLTGDAFPQGAQSSPETLISGIEPSRSGRSRGIPALLAPALLALSFIGFAPDVVAQQLNLSIEATSGDEGDSGNTYYKVTVTASQAPGYTDGATRFFRFDYSLAGDATRGDGKDYKFNGATTGNTIEGNATTHTSKLTIIGDEAKEDDEDVVIKIKRNDVHTFGLDRFPSSLSIDTDTVTFTIEDDD